jgi:hypothetical protein
MDKGDVPAPAGGVQHTAPATSPGQAQGKSEVV